MANISYSSDIMRSFIQECKHELFVKAKSVDFITPLGIQLNVKLLQKSYLYGNIPKLQNIIVLMARF